MTTNTAISAGEILNRAAAEVGIDPVADPYASQDASFRQLQYLLNTAGEELSLAFPWEFLVRSHAIQTVSTDTGDYPLPADFLYMLNQTGWERSQNVPLFGPLSAQDWTYLLGRDLVSQTIYASFRIQQGIFSIFPQPPPDGLDVNFEYITKNWAQDSADGNAPTEAPDKSGDPVLFDRTLITRYVKLKFLEAKGFDTSKAQADFNQVFDFITGKDKGAEILSAGNSGRGYPYLDTWRNTPDTGYGR